MLEFAGHASKNLFDNSLILNLLSIDFQLTYNGNNSIEIFFNRLWFFHLQGGKFTSEFVVLPFSPSLLLYILCEEYHMLPLGDVTAEIL